MDSNTEDQFENKRTLYFYIHLFFAFTGVIIYITAILMFGLYIKYLPFIKREIFTFIILNSIKSFLEITLSSTLSKEIIIYIIGVCEFYLILTYINKSFVTKKISKNNPNFELDYLYYIILIFAASSFPYEKIFNLSEKYIFSSNTVNIILSILLFRYINIKMQLVLEFLKEKKVATSEIPDIYLPYIKAHYYYRNFFIVNIVFYICFFSILVYYGIKISDIFLEWKNISRYLLLFFEEIIYNCVKLSCLIFFYSYNRSKLVKGGKKKRKQEEYVQDSNISNFSVIDVDIQQDENVNLTERKRTKERKLDKEEDNENDENNEKEKENNMKNNEESESLK